MLGFAILRYKHVGLGSGVSCRNKGFWLHRSTQPNKMEDETMVKMKIDNNVSEARTMPDAKSVDIRELYPLDAKSVDIREPYPLDAKSVDIREPYPYVEPELSAVDEAGIYEDSTFASVDIYADGLNGWEGPDDDYIDIDDDDYIDDDYIDDDYIDTGIGA